MKSIILKASLPLLLGVMFALSSTQAEAQFLKKLGKAVENAAERAATRKAEQKTDEAVSKAVDKVTDPDTYKKDGEEGKGEGKGKGKGEEDEASASNASASSAAPKGAKPAEMAYAKSDFVPGDEIIFDDPMDGEQLGEFPSQWDLIDGSVEVASVNGKKAMELDSWGEKVMPLMKNPFNYLGDVFTVEFDFMSVKPQESTNLWLNLYFAAADNKDAENYWLMHFSKALGFDRDSRYTYRWASNTGNSNSGSGEVELGYDTWHHVSVSFNKRAWKMYINGVRIINVPNVKAPPGWLEISTNNPSGSKLLITNVRIARGAVPLYDRLASDGKIITYGITFDVGKATLKPESIVEINRIVALMNDNPDVKFSVEGHTDNTGAAASNQTLSEARSKAVMDKMIELGIPPARLKAAGKGQTAPIADNASDEGRAKNRRVEFVKI